MIDDFVLFLALSVQQHGMYDCTSTCTVCSLVLRSYTVSEIVDKIIGTCLVL